MNERKLLPAISITAGITLIIIGLFGSVSYIITVIESSKLADQSLIFWHLPFLLFGIVFLIIGILYIVIGFKSLHGNEAAHKTTKILLLILFATIIIIGSFIIVNNL
jgi:uncharacterized membrane protein